MASLGEIDRIQKNISNAPFKIIKVLNDLIFETPANRQTRRKLKEFQGFFWKPESHGYVAKLDQISNLGTDIFVVAGLLCLEGTEDRSNLEKQICDSLMDVNSLMEAAEKMEEDDKEESGEDEDDEVDDLRYTTTVFDNQQHVDGSETGGGYESRKVKVECRSPENDISQITSGMHRFSLSFRDVEDSIRTFDGSAGFPVGKWIEELDDTATMLGWSEIQKLIFAKKSTRGIAKVFIQSEAGLSTWRRFTSALREEFEDKTCDADIHQLLRQRKRKKDEAAREYLIVMKEIANRGSVKEDSLIQYVINGINEANENKVILYGAKNIRDFKEKLDQYERLQKENKVSTDKPTGKHTQIRTDVDERGERCFNCGDQSHRSIACPSKGKGRKCFKCNKFGHIAAACPGENSVDGGSIKQISENVGRGKRKEILIMGNSVMAFVDTGASHNIMREDVYTKIGKPALNRTDMRLKAFGGTRVTPRGFFNTEVKIDNDLFTLCIYVVSEDITDFPFLLGDEILDQAEIVINRENVKFNKFAEDRPIGFVNLVMEEEFDINSNARPESRNEIREMMENYKPEKTKTTNVEMTIRLKEDAPVYCRPRRLSPGEE